MRKAILILAAGLSMACAFGAVAGPFVYHLTCPMSGVQNTNYTFGGSIGLSGWVEDVYIGASDGSAGATVVVSVVTAMTNAADQIIATATVSGNKTFHPRVDSTDNAGTALTGDPPGRYMMVNELVRVGITNSTSTGVVWRVTIKAEK